LNKPLISIITITYNSEKTFQQTIDSIMKQGYENLEYIVVDGGSKDKTLEIIKENSDCITKYISEKDNGISDAFNKGIKIASGDVIGIINSDDALCENALKVIAENFDDKTDVYYGDCVVTDDDFNPISILHANPDLSGMSYVFQMAHPSVFVSKKAYEKWGVFNEEYKCAMDYDLLLRFYKNGAVFKYINKNLSKYRVGGQNQVFRKRTIKEVRDISVKHGGNKCKANLIAFKKNVADVVKPITNKLNIHNKRVEML